MNSHDEAGKTLEPILTLFGGADGGVAFVRLRHSFLPSMYSQFEDNAQAAELIRVVEKFSKLCEVMLS